MKLKGLILGPVLLLLLIPSLSSAQTANCPELKGRPIFINGIDNDWDKAQLSKRALQNELEVSLGKGCIQVELAYNNNEKLFLDILRDLVNGPIAFNILLI